MQGCPFQTEFISVYLQQYFICYTSNFSTMTLNDLLDIAIQQEVDSQNLYAHFLSIVKDQKSKSFIESLINEEKKHEEVLSMIKQMEMYDGSILVHTPLSEQEIETSHSFSGYVDKYATTHQILEIALQREHRARNVFLKLAENSKNQELKVMFEKLADEELNHHRQIEKNFTLQQGTMGFEM